MVETGKATTSVAIVVPVPRQELKDVEEVSLRHLVGVLSHYDRYLAVPRSLDLRRPGFEIVRFPDAAFASVATYSRLLLDPDFYRPFAGYEHLLVYQLDCLVFCDRLPAFCRMDFAYIGAPWLRSREDPAKGFSRVGNGGLSLRRVAAALRVLDPRRGRPRAATVLARLLLSREPLTLRRKLSVAREVARGVSWYRSRYSLNEDHFWSDRAPLFDPSFRVADIRTGLAFSFDMAPRYCYERSGRLPFGCHGWYRRDPDFWSRHLLPVAAPTEGLRP